MTGLHTGLVSNTSRLHASPTLPSSSRYSLISFAVMALLLVANTAVAALPWVDCDTSCDVAFGQSMSDCAGLFSGGELAGCYQQSGQNKDNCSFGCMTSHGGPYVVSSGVMTTGLLVGQPMPFQFTRVDSSGATLLNQGSVVGVAMSALSIAELDSNQALHDQAFVPLGDASFNAGNGQWSFDWTRGEATAGLDDSKGFLVRAVFDDPSDLRIPNGYAFAVPLDPTAAPSVSARIGTLAQNHPNPFNPATIIEFTLHQDTRVELAVYDLSGRRVKTLTSDTYAEGTHEVTWNGRDGSGIHVASGAYFYRLQAGQFTETKRMLLLK